MSASFSKKSKQRRMLDLSIRIVPGTIALSIDAAEVTNASNSFESVGHGLSTGDRILFTEDNTRPSGLTDDTQYWVIKTDDDNFQLATTHANALSGTALALASDGTDGNSYDLVEEIAGLDAGQMSGNVQATAVGIYKFNLPAGTFFDEDSYEVMALAHIRDIVVSEDKSARTSSSFTIKVDALDETAALVDGLFAVLISGSAIEDRYSN